MCIVSYEVCLLLMIVALKIIIDERHCDYEIDIVEIEIAGRLVL